MAQHTVSQGDTVRKIARQHGVTERAIVSAPENATLFDTRRPNVLFEGDEVFVPDDDPKTVELPCDRVHTLIYRPRTQRVSLQFRRGGVPRAREPVTWSVDGGEDSEARLDDAGWLHVDAPDDGKQLRVVLLPETDFEEERTFTLGHLDPSAETRGLQQRLNNIGFWCGAEDGDAAEYTVAALEAFQAAHGLPVTGERDEATQRALDGAHGV